jgi:photosystem II stability/assembly factor-like uncharacterized protein
MHLSRFKTWRFKTWAIAGACLIMMAVGAVGARGAIEGVTRTGAPNWLSLFGVAIQPDNHILIVGSKGLLLTSDDQGKTWTQRTVKERPGSDLFQDRDLYAIRFASGGKVGWIVGEDGIVMKTDDAGATWVRQDSGTKKNLFNVFPADDQQVVAVGADGSIIRTTDGGAHWQSVKSPKNVSLFGIIFLDKNTGFTVGEFSTILATTDGGQNWTLAYGGNTGDFTVGPYFSIAFTDPQHGIACGLAGDLLATADGGKTWKVQKLPDTVAAYIVSEDSASKKLWAAGAGGRMFIADQSGQWKSIDRTAFHDITDLTFAGNLGVAVGLNGTILLTNNAGEQWQAVQ